MNNTDHLKKQRTQKANSEVGNKVRSILQIFEINSPPLFFNSFLFR